MEQLESRRMLATYVVNSTADLDDGNPTSSRMTLREAVNLANATAEHDTIKFELSATPIVINKSLGPIKITQPLTIDGNQTGPNWANRTTLSGGNETRILDAELSSTSATVTLKDLAFINAFGEGDSGSIVGADGGAIRVEGGNLKVLNSYFRNNEADEGDGGGIAFQSAGTLTIEDSRFANNDANGRGLNLASGGAVAAIGDPGLTSVVIRNSEFEANTADGGGAMEVRGALTIEGSSFVRNEVDGSSALGISNRGYGGAIDWIGSSSTYGSRNLSIKHSGFLAMLPWTVKELGAPSLFVVTSSRLRFN